MIIRFKHQFRQLGPFGALEKPNPWEDRYVGLPDGLPKHGLRVKVYLSATKGGSFNYAYLDDIEFKNKEDEDFILKLFEIQSVIL